MFSPQKQRAALSRQCAQCPEQASPRGPRPPRAATRLRSPSDTLSIDAHRYEPIELCRWRQLRQ